MRGAVPGENGVLEGQERRRLHAAHGVAQACCVGESLPVCCDPEKGSACVRGRRAPLPRIRAEKTEEAEERRSENSGCRDSSVENCEARLRREARSERAAT